MFQRSLRWNGAGVLVVLALVFGFAAPSRAQAQAPAGAWEVSSVLASWWSGLWGTKVSAANVAGPVDPTRIEMERGSTADPNGLRITATARTREDRARDSRNRPQG